VTVVGVESKSRQEFAEQRFGQVFAHLGLIVAYARRRGARDAEATAAEAMTIAWRRLADVPADDPRPWLIATTRNLLMADYRRHGDQPAGGDWPGMTAEWIDVPVSIELDGALEAALRRLSGPDREALLLVAWEDLSPKAAAVSLGITPAAFRARLHRARRRLRAELRNPSESAAIRQLGIEQEGR
jgi:RNA polymerase sigma factor (sigma-70 family)